MALKGPIPIDSVPSISKRAADLARDLAQIALTKFRFRMGCGLIAASVLLFIAGHLRISADVFEPEFKDRSWELTIWLFIMGGAFSGREVIQAFADGIKSLRQ
jgi:hypothetical protein